MALCLLDGVNELGLFHFSSCYTEGFSFLPYFRHLHRFFQCFYRWHFFPFYSFVMFMSAWFFLIPEWRGRIYLFYISDVFPYLVIYLLWAANQHRTDRIGVIDGNFFRTKSRFHTAIMKRGDLDCLLRACHPPCLPVAIFLYWLYGETA